MKKLLYLAIVLTTFTATTSQAADNKPNEPVGISAAIINIPGNIVIDFSSVFLKSINAVISSIGKAFDDAGKAIETRRNMSK